jgi:hypothetical protein
LLCHLDHANEKLKVRTFLFGRVAARGRVFIIAPDDKLLGRFDFGGATGIACRAKVRGRSS